MDSRDAEAALKGEMQDSIKDYYGKVLSTSKDLKTSACCTAPSDAIKAMLKKVPLEVVEKFYGCGNPTPNGVEGLTILDLGSGSGRDCYVASQMVGPDGFVIGVDMTDEQLKTARDNVDAFTKKMGFPKPNMKFVKGYIERLEEAGIEANSVDLIMSNCVINLSPDKPAVLRGCYRALKDGGEMHFSDVYCDRRLSPEVRAHDVLVGECLGGALYEQDFVRICRQTGFMDPRILEKREIIVEDKALKELLGNARFYSITYRLFKVEGMETLCEDYGQVAYYLGTIPGEPHSYALDDHHVFETNRPMLVCGNSAAMVGDTWLGKHFKVVGDRKVHYGLFPCGPSPAPPASADAPCGPSAGGAACC